MAHGVLWFICWARLGAATLRSPPDGGVVIGGQLVAANNIVDFLMVKEHGSTTVARAVNIDNFPSLSQSVG